MSETLPGCSHNVMSLGLSFRILWQEPVPWPVVALRWGCLAGVPCLVLLLEGYSADFGVALDRVVLTVAWLAPLTAALQAASWRAGRLGEPALGSCLDGRVRTVALLVAASWSPLAAVGWAGVASWLWSPCVPFAEAAAPVVARLLPGLAGGLLAGLLLGARSASPASARTRVGWWTLLVSLAIIAVLPLREPVTLRWFLSTRRPGEIANLSGPVFLSLSVLVPLLWPHWAPDRNRPNRAVLTSLVLLACLSLFLPNLVRARAQGNAPHCKSNLKNLADALQMYSSDSDGVYPKRLGALKPDYLKNIPTCPSAGVDTYTAGYARSRDGKVYTVVCSGHHHRHHDVGPNYPQYSSLEGLIEK